jgi:hypothetical protein
MEMKRHLIEPQPLPFLEEGETPKKQQTDRQLGVAHPSADLRGPCDAEEAAEEQPSRKNRGYRAVFNLSLNTVHEVTPYSEVYGLHPRVIDFGKHEHPLLCCIGDPDADSDSDSDHDDEDEEEPQPFIFRRSPSKHITAEQESEQDLQQSPTFGRLHSDERDLVCDTSARILVISQSQGGLPPRGDDVPAPPLSRSTCPKLCLPVGQLGMAEVSSWHWMTALRELAVLLSSLPMTALRFLSKSAKQVSEGFVDDLFASPKGTRV